jgi:hypothetical protein
MAARFARTLIDVKVTIAANHTTFVTVLIGRAISAEPIAVASNTVTLVRILSSFGFDTPCSVLAGGANARVKLNVTISSVASCDVTLCPEALDVAPAIQDPNWTRAVIGVFLIDTLGAVLAGVAPAFVNIHVAISISLDGTLGRVRLWY